MVPFTGLQINPKSPLPTPTALPFMPPYLAPLTGSTTTPATAENTFFSMDLVPIARPLATFDGS